MRRRRALGVAGRNVLRGSGASRSGKVNYRRKCGVTYGTMTRCYISKRRNAVIIRRLCTQAEPAEGMKNNVEHWKGEYSRWFHNRYHWSLLGSRFPRITFILGGTVLIPGILSALFFNHTIQRDKQLLELGNRSLKMIGIIWRVVSEPSTFFKTILIYLAISGAVAVLWVNIRTRWALSKFVKANPRIPITMEMAVRSYVVKQASMRALTVSPMLQLLPFFYLFAGATFLSPKDDYSKLSVGTIDLVVIIGALIGFSAFAGCITLQPFLCIPYFIANSLAGNVSTVLMGNRLLEELQNEGMLGPPPAQAPIQMPPGIIRRPPSYRQ